ncbi:MAG: glycosyltransferase [Sphingobacteriales bacterium]|nr:MAG: glycosyltransferase [Sphingobacteriales bacterium]
MQVYPKISIVTPSFNDVKYLEQTIRSILDQGYPNLEYLVIDGGSTDGSIDIIKKYSDRISYWISEKDQGMYHAINKGFQRTTGEIMGWINSDDMHHPGSLFTLGQIFYEFKDINWLQGFPNTVDEKGRIIHASQVYDVDKFFFYQKKHGITSKFIQQESTFWRRSLWEKAGGYISTEFRFAGDFELWIRYFQYERLFNIYGMLGSFRLSSGGQASVDHFDEYLEETYRILEKYPLSGADRKRIRYRNWIEKIENTLKTFHKKVQHRLKLNHRSVVNDKLYFDPITQRYRSYQD